jgi:hypothetical protein
MRIMIIMITTRPSSAPLWSHRPLRESIIMIIMIILIVVIRMILIAIIMIKIMIMVIINDNAYNNNHTVVRTTL